MKNQSVASNVSGQVTLNIIKKEKAYQDLIQEKERMIQEKERLIQFLIKTHEVENG